MSAVSPATSAARPHRAVWWIAFGVLALYVAVRMGAFSPEAMVSGPGGVAHIPTTFASVDHPFHVTRAEVLWRELADGNLLRWVGQHQGGYPAEFYPLGVPWLEVTIRALSLSTLTAEGAHTFTVALLFLLPGAAYVALARLDGRQPAVALLALALHVSLPGSWYHGGYTELVQWGLITNVAGAVATLLVLPALVRFFTASGQIAGGAAVFLAAFAIYANPRSLVGLVAVGAGAVFIALSGSNGLRADQVLMRASQVAILTALLAAPELLSLLRFGDLYTFVHYSGYTRLPDFAEASMLSVGAPVSLLAVGGVGIAFVASRLLGLRSVAASMVIYVGMSAVLAFVPVASNLATQLEPTRLMPLQRLFTIYLAATAVTFTISWLISRTRFGREALSSALIAGVCVVILAIQTRPLAGPPLDPASPVVPPASLFAVTMSGNAEQTDLESAVRAADAAAEPGTAMLVIGSAVSWHQQLWSPLWTDRFLFYDNWLWFWHPDHYGTPGYRPMAGHHYPDPEKTLSREYLERHGIGAVVVAGPTQVQAQDSPLLSHLRDGVYDAYLVRDPVSLVTVGGLNIAGPIVGNGALAAESNGNSGPAVVRVNWHPRWQATLDGKKELVTRRADGYLEAAPDGPVRTVRFDYVVQPWDVVGRALALAGLAGVLWLLVSQTAGRWRWYSRQQESTARPMEIPGSDGVRIEPIDVRREDV